MEPISRLTRADKLLGGLDVAAATGIEIGALNAPMLRPPAARVRYVDHADQAALRAKYAGDAGIDPADIVPVDAVWGGQTTLAACFPGETFDYVIASHVAEHVPDLAGWLAEVGDVLKPNGRLILALPDRRYTYDRIRRGTSLAELVDNHLRGARRPTPGQVYDSCANTVAFGHTQAWFEPMPEAFQRFADPAWALARAREAVAGAYVDAHCTVFTARSLLELLDGLLGLGLLRFRVDRFHVAPVGSAEISLVLRPLPAGDGHAVQAARAGIAAFLAAGADSEGLPLDEAAAPDAARLAAEAELQAMRNALAAMRASTSWRLTAPVRALAGRLRSLAGNAA